MGTIAVGLAGAFIAALVYRLNAEKLFFEIMDRRRSALNTFKEAIAARQREVEVRAVGSVHLLSEQPALSSFWRARDDLSVLYGDEVRIAAGAVETALHEYAGALYELRELATERDVSAIEPARRKHQETVSTLYSELSYLSDLAKPYIELGHRGLGVGVRIKLARDRWTK